MVLFLDIDGVLNNFHQVKQDIETSRQQWYERIPVVSSSVGFYEPSLKLVNKFINQFDPDIVITSSWRKIMAFEDLIQLLKANRLRGRIIGTVRDINVGERYNEIKEWIDNNNVTDFLIFEDAEEDVLLFPNNNVVFIEEGWLREGFTESHFEEALQKAISLRR